jgi:polyhydroxybutyrate depolymerase
MRWTRPALTAVLLFAAAGCGGDSDPPAPPGPGMHVLSLEWEGEGRRFVLDVPPGHDPTRPAPLVLVMHGTPGSAEGIQYTSGMTDLAESHGALVAYPDQLRNPEFGRALVAHLSEQFAVAPGQVYAAGFSRGGDTVFRYATEAADVFAAIAAVSGPFLGSPESVTPAEPVSVIAFLGLADQATLLDMERGLEVWRTVLGCPAGEPSWVDEAEQVSRTQATCGDGSEVVEYQVDGMTHAWPRYFAGSRLVNETIWEFFAAHARG